MNDNESHRREVEQHFADENRDGDARVVTSPSGRYRLTIQSYRRQSGAWNYTRGTVLRLADDTLVSDIKRNYGVFHHSFVTKDGRELLVTGRSYMSQTIVDLDRGVEYEPSGDHFDGHAFCWAKCYLSPDGNTLAVDGCHWACPYEYRFFDFTDPARGWEPLSLVGTERVEDPSDRVPPRWLDERRFECHQLDHDSTPQERSVLERRGQEMVLIDHWVSDAERARRDEAAREEAEIEAWWETFSTTDPMYLRYVELVVANKLPDDMMGYRPGSRRIVRYFRRVNPRASADLTWDVAAQTLVVRTYDADGNGGRDASYPHTVAGIDAALADIKQVFERV